MKSQIIVTIGREFGSGGHEIAKLLAERLGVKLYDKELLYALATHHGYSEDFMRRYDEKPVNVLTSRRVRDFSNSIEENLAHKMFAFIKKLAENGESFVVVGRCAEHVLKGRENVLRVFVRGEHKDKENRICELYNVSPRKAVEMMKRSDKMRKLYHDYYTDIKWGDARGYDVSINSSLLGVEKSADALFAVVNLMRERGE